MSVQARLRRVARLESFVIPYLARLRQEDLQRPRLMLGSARTQLANIALLSLYGKPRLTEFLSRLGGVVVNRAPGRRVIKDILSSIGTGDATMLAPLIGFRHDT